MIGTLFSSNYLLLFHFFDSGLFEKMAEGSIPAGVMKTNGVEVLRFMLRILSGYVLVLFLSYFRTRTAAGAEPRWREPRVRLLALAHGHVFLIRGHEGQLLPQLMCLPFDGIDKVFKEFV